MDVGSSDGEWAAGVSITNMGTPISYTVDADKTPIPTNLRLGGRFTYNIDDYNSISGTVDLNKLLVPTPPVMRGYCHRRTGGRTRERRLRDRWSWEWFSPFMMHRVYYETMEVQRGAGRVS